MNQLTEIRFDKLGFGTLRDYIQKQEREFKIAMQDIARLKAETHKWRKQEFGMAVVRESAEPTIWLPDAAPATLQPGHGKFQMLKFTGKNPADRTLEQWKEETSRADIVFKNPTCEPLLEERLIWVDREHSSKEFIGTPVTATTIEKFEIQATILAGATGDGTMINTCVDPETNYKYSDNSDVIIELHNPCTDIVVDTPPLAVWASPNQCCQWIIHLVCC